MKVETLIIYILIISIFSILLTIYDKIASKKFKRNRIRENVLLFFAFIGGGLFMYITMRIIKHKTRHKKFMLGIPIMVIFHFFIITYFLLIYN
ncbi:MAG: DUF1294 domain-containing protein [Anaerococcus hydrogenalis]|uniref:DUF1294 domain-containing protein n=1 Tax=Anaerococcus hydrogenalis TaxID=33029 RepID=UPI0029076A34|nr:DUF1294 domain-containing protein [Anaerococcus hydrogenalis]MDU3688129.1 DUF1294 domain-containing protein [Anaerococcus hydrogenalis]